MKTHRTVDEYLNSQTQWQDELIKLREILCASEMEECLKWGAPCYTVNGKNVAGIGAFKSYVGIWFFQGALLSDPKNVLINAQEGTTKALRQWRFSSAKEIDDKLIRSYLKEAIDNQKQGRGIKADRNKPLVIPEELRNALRKNNKAQEAFSQFTKGRQREYAEYIAEAKREDTRQKRLEKILPMIEAKVGLNDKYR